MGARLRGGALPGNPVSTIVTLDQIVKPTLKKLSGENQTPSMTFKALLNSDLRKRPGRREYQRGCASINEHGNWQVKSTGPQGSARLSSIAEANCYIILSEQNAGASEGDFVDILLFDRMLS